ncbi:MAG: bifunctional riboflavin kinase/FAD synthetase [Candidatus Nanopelagicales bacterium]
MRIWRSAAELPGDLPATSVTIGTFDGVHLGHRRLLAEVTGQAATAGLIPTVVTFDPHPLAVLRPAAAPRMLATVERRLELLAAAGVDATLLLTFDRTLAGRSAEWFAVHMLAEALNARAVSVGRNFRFGHRASGDLAMLCEYGRELGFTVRGLDLACAVDGIAVSSSAIRARIAEGDVTGAAALLGRPHRLTGEVVHGDHRGRELGYPTANLRIPPELAVPGDGVYAGWLHDGIAARPAAISIGTNPTFSGGQSRVEAYVIDAPVGYDLYGQAVDLDFAARLRETRRFGAVSDLVAQMADDVVATRDLIAR